MKNNIGIDYITDFKVKNVSEIEFDETYEHEMIQLCENLNEVMLKTVFEYFKDNLKQENISDISRNTLSSLIQHFENNYNEIINKKLDGLEVVTAKQQNESLKIKHLEQLQEIMQTLNQIID